MELSRATMKKLFLLIGFGALLLTAPQWIGKAGSLLSLLLGILFPFLAGAALAFALNVPMRFLENRLLSPLVGEKAPAGRKQIGRAHV